jgi:hypothetical protein
VGGKLWNSFSPKRRRGSALAFLDAQHLDRTHGRLRSTVSIMPCRISGKVIQGLVSLSST